MKMTYIVEVERGSEEEEMLRRRFNRYIINGYQSAMSIGVVTAKDLFNIFKEALEFDALELKGKTNEINALFERALNELERFDATDMLLEEFEYLIKEEIVPSLISEE